MQFTHEMRHDERKRIKNAPPNKDGEKYRNMHTFLFVIKTVVTSNQYLWERFLFWSTLDEKTALECLTYGTMPIVRSFDDSSSHGDFDPKEPSYINVNKNLCESLQNNPSEQSFKTLEALVLHELVHWGRYQTNTKDGYYYVIGSHWEMKPGGEFVENQVPLELDSGKRFNFDTYINPAQPHIGYRKEPYVSPKQTKF